MGEPHRDEERMWESGWEAHTIAQRRRLGRLALAEKLRWLEDAQRLVFHLTRSSRGVSQVDPPPLGRPPAE